MHTLRSICALGMAALAMPAFAAVDDAGQNWKLRRAGSDRVRFTLERSRAGSRWTNSSDMTLDRFRNLSLSALDRGGDARFEFVQDAGRVICTGRFSGGQGSGTWTFARDPEFAGELRRLGFGDLDEEQQLSAMMHGLTAELARSVRDAGIEASFKELIEMRIHGVKPEFLRQLQASGYKLPARDVIEMRIHGVTPEFVRDVKAAGYEISGRQIAELRIHGVTSEYLRALQSYGVRPRPEDLVRYRIHGVTPEYLKALHDTGQSSLTVDEVVNLRIHGVSPEFLREANELGYRFTPREFTELRIHGVSGEYLRKLRDAGMKNLTAQQIAKLKMNGVY